MDERSQKDTDSSFLSRLLSRLQVRKSDHRDETVSNSEDTEEKRFDQQRRESSVIKKQILSGTTQNLDTDALALSGITATDHGYYIAVIHIRENGSARPENDLEHEMTCFTLESVISDLSEGRLSAAAVYMQEHYCVVISQLVPDINEIYLNDLFEQITELFENEYGQKLCVALSHNAASVDQISNARHEADLLYDFIRTIDSERSVVILNDIRSEPVSQLKDDFIKQLQVLISAVLLEKYDLIPSLVKTILNDHVSGLKGHFGIVQSRLKIVSGILIESVLSLGLNDHFETNTISGLLHAETVPDLISATEECFSTISNDIHSSEGTDVVSVSCRFIADNLSDFNLGVPEISEAAGVSAQYLSRVFKKKIGVSIVEYVNRCRMDYAKQLLSKSDSTIQVIAEESGYNNTVTFTRNFKRYIGMTPSEYRSLNNDS